MTGFLVKFLYIQLQSVPKCDLTQHMINIMLSLFILVFSQVLVMNTVRCHTHIDRIDFTQDILQFFISYHEQGFLHPPRPATFQQPGFLIGDIHFVSSANQRAPYQNNIVCKSNFIQKSFACHLQRLSHFFLT